MLCAAGTQLAAPAEQPCRASSRGLRTGLRRLLRSPRLGPSETWRLPRLDGGRAVGVPGAARPPRQAGHGHDALQRQPADLRRAGAEAAAAARAGAGGGLVSVAHAERGGEAADPSRHGSSRFDRLDRLGSAGSARRSRASAAAGRQPGRGIGQTAASGQTGLSRAVKAAEWSPSERSNWPIGHHPSHPSGQTGRVVKLGGGW